MKKYKATAFILSITAIWLWAQYGCSLLIKVVPEKQPETVIQPAAQQVPTASKPKTKNRIETLREEHNKEWLNLPHRESENELFQPK